MIYDEQGRIVYVLGIVFIGNDKILLQQKNRGNEYIMNKFNGLGGKVEQNETIIEAMEREFNEETGWYEKVNWVNMMEMNYPNCILNVLYTKIDDPHFLDFEFVVENDDNPELLKFIELKDLPSYKENMPNNLFPIIEICLDDLYNG